MSDTNQKNLGDNLPDYYSIIAGKIVGTPGFLERLLGPNARAALREALGTVGISDPDPRIINALISELNNFKESPGSEFVFPRAQMYLADSMSKVEMI